ADIRQMCGKHHQELWPFKTSMQANRFREYSGRLGNRGIERG
ncbi:MAG: hypothetical protein ACI9P7_001970, partial [Candidatus Azotimanducaceae bacterium]